MRGQQGESHQQSKQVGQHHPFVAEMDGQSPQARTGRKAGERQFVSDDHAQSGQRHNQRVAMKRGDARQGQGEQDEFEGNAGNHGLGAMIAARAAGTKPIGRIFTGGRRNPPPCRLSPTSGSGAGPHR